MDNRNLNSRSEKSIFANRQAHESARPDSLFVKSAKTAANTRRKKKKRSKLFLWATAQ